MTRNKHHRNDFPDEPCDHVFGGDVPPFVDQVSAVNVATIGLGPALSAVQSYLGASMAQQRLFHDAVSQQANGAMAALQMATAAAGKILEIET